MLDSLTINLSAGLLPVLVPVNARKDPLLTKEPSPLATASLINSGFERSITFDISSIYGPSYL